MHFRKGLKTMSNPSLSTMPEKIFSKCTNLHIDKVPANIRIARSHDDQFHITATGDKDDWSGIITETIRDSLFITYRFAERHQQPQSRRKLSSFLRNGGKNICFQNSNGSFSFIFGHGNVVTQSISDIYGHNIVISNGTIVQNSAPLILDIAAPAGTNVHYVDTHGASLQIADLAGDLDLQLHSSGNIDAEYARNLRALIQGSGDIYIDTVDGDSVMLTSRGSGDIAINSGKSVNLTASIMGSSDIDANITVSNADLSVLGSGDIRISRVTGRLTQRVQGSGDIVIDYD